MRLKLWMVMLCLLMVGTVSAQQNAPVRVVDVVHITDLFPERTPRIMDMSPDGTKMVFLRPDALCIYQFESTQQDCIAAPDNLGLSQGIKPEWSPDGRFVAITEDPFRRLFESDIWLLDVENRTFIHRTDDGVYGSVLRPQDGNQPIPVDFSPIWNPVSGDLYFFRIRIASAEGSRLNDTYVFRIPADQLGTTSEPEEVAFLSNTLADHAYPVYASNRYGLSGVAAISPDGTRLAFLVRPMQAGHRDEGIWTLDLESGELEQELYLEEIVPLGMPAYTVEALQQRDSYGYVLEALDWTSDSAGLVFNVFDYSFNPALPWLSYHLDLTSGTITPLADFSDVRDAASMFTIAEGEAVSPRYDQMQAMVLLPGEGGFLRGGGDVVLNFNFDNVNQQAGISAIPLPPTGESPVRLYQFDDFEGPYPMDFYSIGGDGQTYRALLFGYVVTLERE
ncbi:MAG: hypothetical protein SF029_06030 [bacterium]|nr:hypothetical protein [bacterium]